ncbi:MAG: endonuclease [Bryobacterales bacterium]|nr:endonuclease [Bryobacterales bacterium]
MFIEYYWRQSIPYATATDARILLQNYGKQAAVLNLLHDARREYSDSLPLVMKRPIWRKLVRGVARTVSGMPLRRLQRVGPQILDFLYSNVQTGDTIELRAGVAYCLRKFHGLVSDLVRGAWVRYVRRLNASTLAEATDLDEFLFGSERAVLAAVRPALMDLQRGRCFYCATTLKPADTEVDHFVPWSRYPSDLGHNFVLADSRCNRKKSDRLAAYEHLAAWSDRYANYGDQIRDALADPGLVSELAASNRVVGWAYSQAEAAGG